MVKAAGSSRPAYDAFLSYNVALDGLLAPALQRGIERYAKPWHRPRACRVFRDTTNLSAAPDLWAGILAALDASRFLVLLASPEAARSKWVRKEVEHWLARRGASSLLFVLTRGDIAWDDGAGDFDWTRTTALPSVLARTLAKEPLFVDLRWAREPKVDLSLQNPLFAQAVLSLASGIRGLPMDELGGENVRQMRATRRLAIGAVAVIAGLGVAAGLGAWVALSEAQRANERSSEVLRRESLRLAFAARGETASGNATDAISLALAALPRRFDEGAGALAWNVTRPPDRPVVAEAAGALVEALSLQREIRVHGPIAGSGDGHFTESGFLDGGTRLFGLTRGGRLVVWSTETGAMLSNEQGPVGEPKFFALDRDGTRAVVVDEDGSVTYWLPGQAGKITRLPVTSPRREGWQDRLHVVWLRRTASLLVVSPDEDLRVYEVPSGRLLATVPRRGAAMATIRTFGEGEATLVRIGSGESAEWYAAANGSRSDPPGEAQGGDADHVLRSRDGRVLVTWQMLGSGGATVRTRREDGGYETTGLVELAPRDGLLMSPDGRWIARTHPDGTVRLSNPSSRIREAWISAGSPIAAAEFDSSGRYLLARLDGGSLALFAADVHGWVDGYVAAPGPGYAAAIAPDGKTLAMGILSIAEETVLQGAIVTWDRASGKVLSRFQTGSWPRVIRASEGEALAAVLTDGSMHVWSWPDSAPAWSLRPRQEGGAEFIDVAFAGATGRLFAATRDGSMVEFDAKTGRELARVVLGSGEVNSLAVSPDAKTLVATFAHALAIRAQVDHIEPTKVQLPDTSGARRATIGTSAIAVATASDGVLMFDRFNGKRLGAWPIAGETLNSLTFDKHGSRLAAAAESGTAYVWDLADSGNAIVLRAGTIKLYSASFTPDGSALLTTGHDGRTRIWHVGRNVRELVTAAQRRVVRCLAKERAFRHGAIVPEDDSKSAACVGSTSRRAPELD